MNVENIFGDTAFSYARRNKDSEIEEILEEAGNMNHYSLRKTNLVYLLLLGFGQISWHI